MSRREWIIAALLAFSWGYWFWQHERWHELNNRTSALSAKAEAYSEMCRAMRGSKP